MLKILRAFDVKFELFFFFFNLVIVFDICNRKKHTMRADENRPKPLQYKQLRKMENFRNLLTRS